MLSFQDHRTSDIGEDFLRFLPYMGMVVILDTTSVLIVCVTVHSSGLPHLFTTAQEISEVEMLNSIQQSMYM